eukprot:TRINITY_DN7185_c0_g1_i2.p1 TRINITY_DN7185_c0_g1~~TRINITY_DN7185_c0_g1_i2.p1  ORF type:complete len:446 (+),score=89.76 TRINITY_DN7185_c0_g1_i2:28-1338(+)
MASRPLQRVPGVLPVVLSKLQRANLPTCRDVLSKTDLEIQNIINCSIFEARDLIATVSSAVLPSSKTMLEMCRTDTSDGDAMVQDDDAHTKVLPNHLRTTLASLDELLRIGIPAGAITEVVGPSSVGKTQFCHMLSVIATLPRALGGLDGGVIILDTETSFSAERLLEIASNRFPFHFNSTALPTSDATTTTLPETQNSLLLTSRVHVYNRITSSEALLQKLKDIQTEIIEKKIKLLIIDSIAALVRKEYDGSSIAQRQQLLMQEATLLKYLAENFNIPVVVTNQITTHSKQHRKQHAPSNYRISEEPSKGYVTAALGPVWSHCVNTRLVFEYRDNNELPNDDSSLNSNVRMMTIAKSPISAVYTLPYIITAAGVELVVSRSSDDGTEDEPKEIIYLNPGNFWEGSILSRPTTTPGAVTDAQHTVVTEQQMDEFVY